MFSIPTISFLKSTEAYPRDVKALGDGGHLVSSAQSLALSLKDAFILLTTEGPLLPRASCHDLVPHTSECRGTGPHPHPPTVQ